MIKTIDLIIYLWPVYFICIFILPLLLLFVIFPLMNDIKTCQNIVEAGQVFRWEEFNCQELEWYLGDKPQV